MIFKPTLVIIAIILIVWIFFAIPAHPQTLQHRTGPPQTLVACRSHVADDKYWLNEFLKMQIDFADDPKTSKDDRKVARRNIQALQSFTKQLNSPVVVDRACNDRAALKDFEVFVAQARYSVTIMRELDKLQAEIKSEEENLEGIHQSVKKMQSFHVPNKKSKAKRKLSFTCVSLYRHKYQKDADDLHQPQFLTSAAPSIPCRVVRRSTI